MHNSTEFRIGNYRPIYLWAGPGTIRMNKLKFMQVAVDEKVHLDAHQSPGAELVVNDLYQNWIHLTYNWGFPPEIEQEDWQSFEIASHAFHQHGAKVFAYIQSSNCVYAGSFTKKNWYALTPNGKKVYYYTGRFMTCFQNNDWINYLKERIADAIQRGANGIFFDNLWYGLQPNSLFSTWLGGAGCYCKTCKQTYLHETGLTIPTFMDLQKKEVLNYIEWRAQKMTEVFQHLSSFARSLKHDVIISANDYDPVMRPVKIIFGIDFNALAPIQDVTMIENFALPNWKENPEKILVNNALTVRSAQSFLPADKHLSVLSYDAGIGFDPVYPARRIMTGMAEAAALGCSMTTKGTEYHDGKKMTLLTGSEYHEQQQAIGNFQRWLEANQSIYQMQRRRIAEVGILHPGDLLWQKWRQLAPIFFAVQQTLLANGIPWKVIQNLDELDGLKQIIIFDDQHLSRLKTTKLKIIDAMTLQSWKHLSPSFFDRIPFLRSMLSAIADQLIRTYHGNKTMRKLMDWLGMSKLVTHTPFFKLPDKTVQIELLNLLSTSNFRVISEHPVLMDVWEDGQSGFNIHLVNYHSQNQKIKLKMPDNSYIKILYPENQVEEFQVSSGEITINLDLYCICTVKKAEEK